MGVPKWIDGCQKWITRKWWQILQPILRNISVRNLLFCAIQFPWEQNWSKTTRPRIGIWYKWFGLNLYILIFIIIFMIHMQNYTPLYNINSIVQYDYWSSLFFYVVIIIGHHYISLAIFWHVHMTVLSIGTSDYENMSKKYYENIILKSTYFR